MIYAIGDSFTAGGELPGCNWDSPGKGAWPEVLGELINQPIINKGRLASGNTRIVKRAVDAVLSKAECIIICWTSIDRQEFIDKAGIYDVWPGRDPRWWLTNKSHTNHRLELVKYLTNYQSDFKSQLYAYKNWLRQIILIQSLCKANNVNCVMLIAFGAFENFSYFAKEKSVQELLNAIDLSMFVKNTLAESTVEWTHKTQKMPMGHPGPEGHQIIANQIYEHIRNLGWVS